MHEADRPRPGTQWDLRIPVGFNDTQPSPVRDALYNQLLAFNSSNNFMIEANGGELTKSILFEYGQPPETTEVRVPLILTVRRIPKSGTKEMIAVTYATLGPIGDMKLSVPSTNVDRIYAFATKAVEHANKKMGHKGEFSFPGGKFLSSVVKRFRNS